MNRDNVKVPLYCHPLDKQVINEGNLKCNHLYPLEPNETNDTCVHFICKKCRRELCFGILK